MLSVAVFLQSILGILGAFALFYVTGRLFNYLLNRRKTEWGWLPTYFYVLCGMLLCISIFAAFKTGGLTILLPIPVLTVLLALGVNRNFVFVPVQGIRQKAEPFLFFLGAALIAYLYYAYSFRAEAGMLHYIWGDLEYYSRVAENVHAVGIENMRVEYLYPHRFTVEPFHYGDIWTIAFAASLASVKPVVGATLVAAPLLLSLVALGVAALVQYFFLAQRKTHVLYLLIIVGLIGGFGFLFPGFVFPARVDVYFNSMSNYTKLLWWASIAPLLFCIVMNKSDSLLVYLVFIIGLGYINVLPGLAMGSFLWLLYIAFRRKEFLPALLQITWVSVLCGLCFYVLYALYPSLTHPTAPASGKATFSLSQITANIRTSVNIFIGGALQFSVYLPPLLLLAILLFVEKIKFAALAIGNLVVYGILVLCGGLFVWAALFTTTIEAIQFFYNILVVVAGILSALIYLYVIICSSKKALKIAAVVLLCLSVFSNLKYDINVSAVSKKEYNAVLDFVARGTATTMVHYKDPKEYTGSVSANSTITRMPYSFLSYTYDRYQNVSLNVSFCPVDSNSKEYRFQQDNINWAPMTHFIKVNRDKYLSQDELMQAFMKTNKVEFLCMPLNNVIPASLQQFAVDSLYTQDIGWKIFRCSYSKR